jgi:hypothetical protein
MSNFLSTKGLVGTLGDVRRSNNFVVGIEDVTEDTNLELVIQQAFLPQVSLSVLELRHGNDAKKLAGVATWTGGTISIIDTLSKTELDALLAWFKLTYDPATGKIGYSGDYKKNGYIAEYAADGSYERKWPVEGMWISSPDFGKLDSSTNDLKQISFVIEIDPPRSGINPTYNY